MHTRPSAMPAAMDGHASTASESTQCTAAALGLMTHYAQQPCPLVAHAIAQQLGHISSHCSEGSSRTLQSFATALLSRWRIMACGTPSMIRH